MLQVKVEAIRWEAVDTATFFLSNVSGKKIVYQAGQFVTLVFEHHGEELRRSYSISSSPDEELLAITVKRVPNGELSRFMLTHAKVGDVWSITEPTGRFLLAEPGTPADLFFFAAGSGITPILSQIKYLLGRVGNHKLHLIYSNRNERSILFKDELNALHQQHPQKFSLVHLLSDEGKRLNNVTVEKLVPGMAQFDLQNARFYLCGPFDYMRMVRFSLTYMGLPPENIRKENFVINTIPVADPKQTFAPRKLSIIFGGETHIIQAGENQSILQAALQNNIRLPYSCRSGICSACTVKCTSGKVTIMNNEVLTDDDLTNGWVLTCTGYAVSDDVVIDFDGKRASS